MDTTPSRAKRYGSLAAVAAAGLATGALVFGVTSANAADTTTPSTGSSGTSTYGTSPQGLPPQGMGHGVPGGADPVRSDEKAVTADQAATLEAAALKAVPGGTVVRVESDAGDAAYEAHMTKADGTVVTVKFDKNLAVIEVQDGMGLGDPQTGGPAGAPGASGSVPSASPSA